MSSDTRCAARKLFSKMKFVNDAIIEKARLLEQHQHELMDVLGIPEDAVHLPKSYEQYSKGVERMTI